MILVSYYDNELKQMKYLFSYRTAEFAYMAHSVHVSLFCIRDVTEKGACFVFSCQFCFWRKGVMYQTVSPPHCVLYMLNYHSQYIQQANSRIVGLRIQCIRRTPGWERLPWKPAVAEYQRFLCQQGFRVLKLHEK